MKSENVHLLIDLCIEGGRIRQYFPELNKGLAPRDIRVAEQLLKLSKVKQRVRVSDISEMLEVTRPGITAALNTLTKLGYVEKERDTEDGRIVYVRLTEQGHDLVRTTVTDFHRHLAETAFSQFDDEEVLRAADLIRRTEEAMKEWSKSRIESHTVVTQSVPTDL